MQCCFCGQYVKDIEEAVEEGFYPDFWHHEVQYQGPVCPDCQKEHLETDEDGEFILKAGHSLPPDCPSQELFSNVEDSDTKSLLRIAMPVLAFVPNSPSGKSLRLPPHWKQSKQPVNRQISS